MRPTLPVVLSATALVVTVLGATPLGAIAQNAAFPRNSVGTGQLKRNAVTPAKLAPNAVRSAHVLDGSLLASDFKPGQLPQGPKGDKGDKGDKGERGDPGVPATRLWAWVDAAGAIRRSSGVTRVTKDGFASYLVEFNQTITGCAIVAGQAQFALGFASALGVSATTARVYTASVSSSGASVAYPAHFSVAAFC